MQEERDGDHSLEKFCSSGGCRADVSGGSVLGRAQIFFVSVCVCAPQSRTRGEQDGSGDRQNSSECTSEATTIRI